MKSFKPTWTLQPLVMTVALLCVFCGIGAKNARAATFAVTNTNDSGTGSLRAAITSANATSATDTITFNISGTGVHTIAPTSNLPVVTQPLTIDGATQPGFAGLPLVQLNGANVSGGLGLVLGTSNCTVNALTINGWSTVGVSMTGSGTVNSHIQGCLVGLNVTAKGAVPNGIGILISGGANANFIGGASSSLSNFIAGNTAAGIGITGSGSNSNFVTGNFIGTDGQGKTAIPNVVGVLISGGAQNNTIGGNSTSVRNVVAGNSAAGISIKDAGSSGNSVAGNFIGMGADGVTKVPNKFAIIVSAGASGNTIGATGNGANLISGNLGAGICFIGSNGNTVTNNVIGPDVNSSRLPGNGVGVAVTAGSQNNVVGPGNLITSSFTGVDIEGTNTSNNSVIGNYIGTSANPTSADPNSPYANFAGISISGGAQGNTIGGTTAAARNIVSGSTGIGISINGANTNGNAVEGNFIGTNVAGDGAIPNSTGVFISGGASFNSIGGSGAGNLISGNDGIGVGIAGSGTNNNSVQGNTIGATPSTTQALPNGTGVSVDEGARNTLIGGITAGTGNFISGNHGAGIEIKGASSSTTIERNYIGCGVGGNGSIPNGQGITIDGNSQFTVIGADKALSDRDQIVSVSNVIANNPVGVSVKGALSYNNTIRGNAFRNNGSTIDLGGDGPTVNDDKDGDDGPNRLQNTPVIMSVTRNSDNTGNEIVGTLNSAPGENFIIDIYSKTDSSSNNVNSYVGQTSVATNSDGNANFDITSIDANTDDASHYVATATRAGTGDTSEFSASAVVAPNVTITSPASGSRLPGVSSVSGTATSPYGIAHVDLYIIRLSDGTYWDGKAWGGGGSAILPTSYDANTKTWTSTGPLPSSGGTDPNTSFTAGDYDIIAQAYDTNGTMTRADSGIAIEYHTKYTYTGLAATCPYSDQSACASFVPGNARDFYDVRNWSPQGVPGSNDTATIGNFDVALDKTDDAKGSVVLGGLNLQGGALSGASLSFSSATGSDNVFNWSGGFLNVKTMGINATGTLNISGDGLKDWLDSGIINNAGTTTFSGAGQLRGRGHSTFNNLSGATFIVKNDGGLFANYNGSNVFNNAAGATFKKQNDFNDPSSVSTLNTWTFNNSGAIVSNTGTLNFNNEATNFADGSTISGSSHTQLSGTAFTFTGTTTLQNTTFDMASGYLTGTGTLASSGSSTFNWTGGTILRLNVAAGTTFNLSGTNLKDIDAHGIINNSGNATMSGVGALRGLGTSTFNNLSGATFTLASDAPFNNYNGSNSFNNLSGATFEKTIGVSTASSQINWAFNNSGTTRSSQGVLALNGDTLSTDSGTFTTATPGIVRFLGGNHSLKAGTLFTGTGKAQVTGATVTAIGNAAAGTSSAGTTFEVSSGTLTSASKMSFTSYGTFNWTGGVIGGTCNMGVGTAFNLSGANLKDIDAHGIINNSGHATMSDVGALRGIGTSTFNNLNGATFTLATDASFVNYNGSNAFNNLSGATFEKTLGSSTTTTPGQINWAFNNSGVTRSAQGVLALNGDTTSTDTGTFTTVTPGVMRFVGGNHILKTGTLFNGTGKNQVAGATLTVAGNAVIGSTTAPTTFEMSSGIIAGTSATNLTSYGTINWTGGVIGGKVTIAPKATFNLNGTNLKDIDAHGIINNFGHVTMSGVGALRGIGVSTFNNLNGATLTLASDASFINYNGSNSFNNLSGATFEKTVGLATASSQINWAFNNSGIIRSAQGVLALNGDTASTDSGTFATVTPGIVRFIGGNHSLKTGTLFTGTGKIQQTGANLIEAGNIVAGSPSAKTTLEVSGGTITGTTATNLTTYGTLNWTGGSIGGVLNIASGSGLNLLGANLKDIGDHGTVNNSGVTVWTGPGVLRGLGTSTFNNQRGGIFDVQNNGALFGDYNGSNVFNNAAGATLRKSVGTGISAINTWTTNLNGCTISILSGVLQAQSTVNILGTPTTISGAGTLRLSAANSLNTTLNSASHVIFEGSLAGSPSAHYAGAGLFDWLTGPIYGTMFFDAGTKVNLSGTGLKDIGDHGVINNSGAVTWAGTGVLRGLGTSTFNNLKGGAFNVSADGPLLGSYNGGNIFNNALGASFVKMGGTKVSNVGIWTFNNNGAVLANAGIAATSGDALEFDADLNLNGGTIGGTRFTRFNGGTLNIAGMPTIVGTTFELSAGTIKGTGSVATTGAGVLKWTNGAVQQLTTAKGALLTIAGVAQRDVVSLTNNGTATWTGGNIRGLGGAVITNAAGATFTDVSKASLVDYNGGNVFKNAGTFKTGNPLVGKTTMSWGFTQLGTGILSVDVTSAATTGFDLYGVGGPAMLAGTLQIVRPTNYLPPVGSMFKFLTHGTRTGQFATVQNTAIDSTRVFQVVYNMGDATLKVAPKTAASPKQTVSTAPTPTATPEAAPTQEPTPSPTVAPTPVPTQIPNASASLSSASVNVGSASVQLAFVQILDEVSASDLTHYSVTVNGHPVELMGVLVKGGHITLLLPGGALHGGDSVEVTWSGLKDRARQTFTLGSWSNGQNLT